MPIHPTSDYDHRSNPAQNADANTLATVRGAMASAFKLCEEMIDLASTIVGSPPASEPKTGQIAPVRSGAFNQLTEQAEALANRVKAACIAVESIRREL